MYDDKPGWIRLTKLDKPRRRALWMRVTDKAVEFCAGREGDDSYVRIPRRERSLDRKGLYLLQDVARTAEWGVYECDWECTCTDEKEDPSCAHVLEDQIAEAQMNVFRLLQTKRSCDK